MELLDERDHLLDVFGGARLYTRRQAAERRGIGVELRRGLLGQFADRDALLRGARVDLVVDVGDVADVNHVLRPIDVAQKPEEHVEGHRRPAIADMGEIVDRRAADIHAHGLCIEWLENFFLLGPGIVKLQCHKPCLGWRASILIDNRVPRQLSC